MNLVLKTKVIRYLKPIALLNTMTIVLYNLIGTIAEKWDMVLRGWMDIVNLLSIVLLSILIIGYLNQCLCAKIYSKIQHALVRKTIKVISSLIAGILIILDCLFGFYAYYYIHAPEYFVYHKNQNVIAKVSKSYSYARVDFYQPVNLFLMKKTGIASELYDGRYDK